MKTKNRYTHFMIKDKYGTSFLCPLGMKRNRTIDNEPDYDECFEKNVPGRYAARIRIRES